jgi:hypothetical protein
VPPNGQTKICNDASLLGIWIVTLKPYIWSRRLTVVYGMTTYDAHTSIRQSHAAWVPAWFSHVAHVAPTAGRRNGSEWEWTELVNEWIELVNPADRRISLGSLKVTLSVTAEHHQPTVVKKRVSTTENIVQLRQSPIVRREGYLAGIRIENRGFCIPLWLSRGVRVFGRLKGKKQHPPVGSRAACTPTTPDP